MEALLSGDFDDDDDDDDDSFDEGDEKEDDNDDGDDDDDDDNEADDDDGPAQATYSRLPLHELACAGKVESLTAVLGEGARTGSITIGKNPDGSARTVMFDLNQANEQCEYPLHATILAAANDLALASAPPNDPWKRESARDDVRLVGSAAPTPLASEDAAPAALNADAEARLACMKLLLDAGAEPERKVYGRSALHLACACAALPALAAFAAKAVEQLLAAGASITQVDTCGKTPVHYAAVGFYAAVGTGALKLLLGHPSAGEAAALVDKSGATALHDALRGGKACVPNALPLLASGGRTAATAADADGLTPLHLAKAAGLEGVAKELLSLGADPLAKDTIGRTPSDLADVVNSLRHSQGFEQGCGRMLPTWLLAHPASLLHNAPAGMEADRFAGTAERRHFGQPECAARLRTLLSPAGHLRGCRYAGLEWRPAPLAHITDVLRCHEYTYLERVRTLCDGLAAAAAAEVAAATKAAATRVSATRGSATDETDDPFAPPPSRPLKASLDCDTEVTQHTFSAAMRGAGAVVEAVRAVCATPREARNAFCAVRPPGHHAGPSGAVGGQSAGFCVLANAAIGAAYGMAVHRNAIHKVAIVDFDVHHGNGTEACVQAVVPQPWTESVETPTGTVSASGVTYKPWLGPLDKERIFFASIHGYGADAPPGEAAEHEGPMGAFYPGSGGPNSSSTDVGVGPIVRNVPVRLRTRSAAWRREMLTQMLIPLRSFEPDLILVSAGFDAHAHDALEAGGLHDRDYVWMTSELVRIAEACAQGRLVSVLEGGYQVAGGFVSSLARAVGSHVSALTQPSLLGATWMADEAAERLESALKFEDAWQTNRLAMMDAKAKGSAGGSAAPAAPEQDNGAPARRSKRPRGSVDYGALEVKLQEEEGGEAKKPKGDE
jgi:acetoin utilization deacetylase AcuC-like enzyme/ankyrin repeat protein